MAKSGWPDLAALRKMKTPNSAIVTDDRFIFPNEA